MLLQEYLAQWVAKVASAEKEYRSATNQMNRPPALPAALPQAAADGSSGAHLLPIHAVQTALLLHSRALLQSVDAAATQRILSCALCNACVSPAPKVQRSG